MTHFQDILDPHFSSLPAGSIELVFFNTAAGPDLGFLEWWGRKYKRARSARKNFKPRPLN